MNDLIRYTSLEFDDGFWMELLNPLTVKYPYPPVCERRWFQLVGKWDFSIQFEVETWTNGRRTFPDIVTFIDAVGVAEYDRLEREYGNAGRDQTAINALIDREVRKMNGTTL